MAENILRIISALIIGYGFLSVFSISVGNALIDGALILMFLYCLVKKSSFLTDAKMLWLMIGYCLIIIFASLLSDSTANLWNKTAAIFYYMLPPFMLGRFYVKTGQDRNRILSSLLIGGLTSVGYAFWQALQGVSRVPGFIDLLELAGQLSVLIPVMVVVSTYGQFPYILQKTARILLFPAIASLILNGTRGAWLAVGTAGLVYVGWCLAFSQVDSRIKRQVVAAMVLLIVVMTSIFFAFPNAQARMSSMLNLRDSSLGARFAMWPSAAAMFCDSPLSGVGLGNYPERYVGKYHRADLVIKHYGSIYEGWLDHKHPHNSFLHLAAETGLLGAAAFSVLWGYAVFHLWRQIHTHRLNRAWSLMGLLVICVYLLFGITENVLFGMSQYNQLVWLMLGLCWSQSEREVADT